MENVRPYLKFFIHNLYIWATGLLSPLMANSKKPDSMQLPSSEEPLMRDYPGAGPDGQRWQEEMSIAPRM